MTLSQGSAGGHASNRNAGIDVLRGMAILMVLLLHFSLTYRLWRSGPLVSLFGPGWTYAVIGRGNFGVTMFFVVSGFLISTNAAERSGGLGRIRLRAFYVRRFARLAPALGLALAIITVLGLCAVPSFAPERGGSRGELLLGVLSVLLFFHNILMQHLGWFDYALNVYWSLSVEEVFYLAFPVACLLLRRDRIIAIPCLVLVAAAPFFRAAHAHDDIVSVCADLSCFDAIAIGCLCSMLARRWRPSRRVAVALEIAGWAALVVFWLRGFDGPRMVYGFTAVALSTAAIILGCVSRPGTMAARSAIGRGVRWLGRHSYELYLFHIIVLGVMRDVVPGRALHAAWQLPWLGLFLVLSAAAAAAVARLLGDPLNRAIRGRFLPHRAAPAVPARTA